MKLRISTKYALYSSALLAAVATVVLLAAGSLIQQQADTTKGELREAIGTGLTLNEEQALLSSAAYLRDRLFSPLYELDIARLNEEIAQIRGWLPVTSFLILAEDGTTVLTDGSETNASYGERLPLSAEPAYFEPFTRKTAEGTELSFAIGYPGHAVGFARLTLTDVALRESLAGLENSMDRYWSRFGVSLLRIAALTAVAIVLLGTLLSWHLSRALSMPLTQMNEAARRFATGDLSSQLPAYSQDELGDLARSLNKMAQDLRNSGEMLAKAQEIADLGSWEWETTHKRLLWSEQVYRLFGVGRDTFEPTLANLLPYVKPAERDQVSRLFDPHTLAAPVESEFTIVRADGLERVLHLRGEPVVNRHHNAVRVVGTLQDITERRQAQQQLAYLANYDTLTHLPNRYLFQDRLQQALRRADREGGQVALMFIDLDQFKAVNDAMGHGAGDDLLKLAAARLSGTLRSSDTVARLGGDEFTILLEQVAHPSDAATIAEKVLAVLNQSFMLGSREVFISGSIGITLYPADATDSDALLKNADTAMYQAKERGRNTYFFFTSELNRQAQQRLSLENNLRSAFSRGEFSLHYQPQVYLESGKLIGVEALLRWHSQGEFVPPSRFITVLEETGQIIPIGEWVLEQACTQTRAWHGDGLRDLRVSVNLSVRQLQQRDFLQMLQAVLQRTHLPAEFLEIEITESTLLDTAVGKAALNRLQDIGVRLAIDDFGTGYSSLSYLKRFFVDALKIDRSFIRDIAVDEDDAAITTAIIHLSDSLGIDAIAEGVETEEQYAFLRRQGCRLIQGFLIGKPMPPTELHAWVKGRCSEQEGYHYWAATA
jgi:diguanylate cyclase (GGDEF)-like protein/PAS domain S-box-containing protein